jgi:hypothetical protein
MIALRREWIWKGLPTTTNESRMARVLWSFMPDCKHMLISARDVKALTAMMGTVLLWPRMALVAWVPVISGMSMSMSTSLKPLQAQSLFAKNFSTASRPLVAFSVVAIHTV